MPLASSAAPEVPQSNLGVDHHSRGIVSATLANRTPAESQASHRRGREKGQGLTPDSLRYRARAT